MLPIEMIGNKGISLIEKLILLNDRNIAKINMIIKEKNEANVVMQGQNNLGCFWFRGNPRNMNSRQ